MIVAMLAFLGGVLTILSPCILPVVPFVLARTEQPFARSTLPLLAGMVLAFAAVSTLAAFGGGWAVRLNDYGRTLALVLLAVSGLALLSRRLSTWLARPAVALGTRLAARSAGAAPRGAGAALLLGVATGLLWAPCAGPILGLILTGAALRGPNAASTGLLVAYALGAATSLGVIAAASTRLIAALKRSFAAGEWLRRVLGAGVLAAVATIAFGLDTGVLTRLSVGSTSRLEQALIDGIAPGTQPGGALAMQGAMSGAMSGTMTGTLSGTMTGAMSGAMTGAMTGRTSAAPAAAGDLPVEGQLPPLDAVAWLNSPPLTPQALRGKVVLIDFWTYSCINCLRALPYVESWYARYRDQGLIVIGVHAPEFAFEKSRANVERAVRDLGITYPVALDNDYAIWKAFDNEYWPAHYFVDAAGRIRGHHFGEGDYADSERLIRELLREAGARELPAAAGAVRGSGVQQAPDEADLGSPETYLGYQRAQRFVSAGGAPHGVPHAYRAPPDPGLNDWGLSGSWQLDAERAVATAASAGIVFRFRARDLNLVLGSADPRRAVRFRVTIDGRAPGADHGVDVQPDGTGSVREQRLYQLLRLEHPQGEHLFAIEFLDAPVQAYSFTFG
jgi:cytochrome c biogenesis protein CcdA/thiol-disulfide isomerase/thioredoxin